MVDITVRYRYHLCYKLLRYGIIMYKNLTLVTPVILSTLIASGTALAQQVTPPTIYGLLHLSLDQIDSDIKGNSAAFNTSSNTSRLGIKGKHSFEPQLTAIYQAEATLYATGGDGSEFTFNRDTFFGFQGDWGSLRVGNMNSPTKLLRIRTDLFTSQVGAAGNITGTDGQDNWRRNSVFYTSPEYHGITARLQYSANSKDQGGTQDAQAPAYSASLEYNHSDFWAALAYDESKELQVGKSKANVKAYRAAATYSWEDVSVRVFYNHAEKSSIDGSISPANSDTYGVGLRYLATEKVALKTQVHQVRRDNTANDKATQYAVGADYLYAPNLTFYLNYAQIDAEGIYRSPSNAGRSAQVKLADGKGDENPYAVSLGTIFKF